MTNLFEFFQEIKNTYPDSKLLNDLMLIHNTHTYTNIQIGLKLNYDSIDDLILYYEKLRYPSITCGIITYNESRCIKRCLSSIYNKFDEIIVLDSMSTDNTLDIIRSNFPKIKIFNESWKNDFSYSRNIIMKKASSDWIYFIDADNFYLEKNKDKIKRIIKLIDFLKINCILSPIIIEHDTSISLDNRRIIPLNKNILFNGKVHEEPIESNGNIPNNITVDIIIKHDGYNPNLIDMQKKCLRNIKLTKEMIAIEPLNPKWLYFYGKELYNYNKDISLIKNILFKAIDLNKNTSNRFKIDTISLLCKILFENNEFTLLDKYLNLLEQLSPNCSDINYYRILMIKLNIELKIKKSIQLLQETYLNKSYSFINDSNDHLKLLILDLYISLNDWDNAIETYNSVKNINLKLIYKEQLSLYKDKISNII